jgi:hypothetical protein
MVIGSTIIPLSVSFQHRVKELPGFLGISIGEQLHRSFQVGKENRDLLPLSFERAPRREDLLFQVRWGIDCEGAIEFSWRRGKGRSDRVRGESYPAFPAEEAIRREGCATRWADMFQFCSTAQAKSKISGIVMLAVRTAHTLLPFS